jgi:GAF domain-containing protein
LWQDCKPWRHNRDVNPPDIDRRQAWIPAPVPDDEPARLAALWRTGWLDTPPAEAFDRVTRSVAQMLNVPMALVSLVDEKRQWFLARHGMDARETPRDISFCGHAVAARQTLCVADAWLDPRFAGNPLVTGEPHIRAYLGVPVLDEQGHALGTLCVLDRRVRQFSAAEQQLLERYAKALEQLLRA